MKLYILWTISMYLLSRYIGMKLYILWTIDGIFPTYVTTMYKDLTSDRMSYQGVMKPDVNSGGCSSTNWVIMGIQWMVVLVGAGFISELGVGTLKPIYLLNGGIALNAWWPLKFIS